MKKNYIRSHYLYSLFKNLPVGLSQKQSFKIPINTSKPFRVVLKSLSGIQSTLKITATSDSQFSSKNLSLSTIQRQDNFTDNYWSYTPGVFTIESLFISTTDVEKITTSSSFNFTLGEFPESSSNILVTIEVIRPSPSSVFKDLSLIVQIDLEDI